MLQSQPWRPRQDDPEKSEFSLVYIVSSEWARAALERLSQRKPVVVPDLFAHSYIPKASPCVYSTSETSCSVWSATQPLLPPSLALCSPGNTYQPYFPVPNPGILLPQTWGASFWAPQLAHIWVILDDSAPLFYPLP